MTNSAFKEHYHQQRAPAGALPRALEAFEVRREISVRPRFWGPVVAGALGFALWFGVYLPSEDRSGDLPASSYPALPPLPVLAQLSIPSRPTMPSFASLSLPAGSLAIPRLNQITLNSVNPEET